MRSTSYSAKRAFPAIFKTVARRQLPGAATVAVFCIIASFLCALYCFDPKWRNQADMVYGSMLAAGWVFSALNVYNLFSVFSMFKGSYSRRACDYHLALPYKKEHIFNANFLFGLFVNIVSMILSLGVLYLFFMSVKSRGIQLGVIYSADNYVPVGRILMYFAVVLVIFSVISMCAALAGRSIQYYFLCYVLLVSVPLLLIGVTSRINLIWGVIINPVKALAVTPAGMVFAQLAGAEDVSAAFILIACAVEFVLFYIAGILVFKNRQAETAQNKLSGKIIPAVLFAVFIASGLMIFGAAYSFLSSVLFGVVSAFVCLLIFRAICRGTEKVLTKKAAAAYAAVCAVCILFSALMYFPNYNSYTKYVPQVNEVESVTVTENSSLQYGNEPATLLMNVLFGGYAGDGREVTLTEPENIQRVIDFHTLAVQDEVADYGLDDKLLQEIADTYSGGISSEEPTTQVQTESFADTAVAEDWTPSGNINCIIEYKLKNGKTVERRYTIAYDLWYEYINILQNKEAILQDEAFSFPDEDIIYIEGYYYSDYDDAGYGIESDDVSIPGSQWEGLKEIVINDKLAEDPYDFYSNYTTAGDITVYGINPALPEGEKERIRNLTQEEKQLLVQQAESFVYQNTYAEKSEEPVIGYYIYLSEDDVNSLTYIKQFAS